MNRVVKTCGGLLFLLPCLAVAAMAQAEDVIPSRLMGLDLARDIAQGAIDHCRKDGYQVSVVVTDRSGDALVVMRDVFVSKYMTQLAHGKANAVALSNLSSAEVRVNMARIRDELNLLEGVLLMDGGLPIRVAGSLIGAVGVSGAPGGDKDEACAQQGIEAVQERLDFAD